jgi:alpha-beta hydrolase superfamily lysophospholipase
MKWLRGLQIFVVLYAVIGIAVYYLQDYFLFHPEPLTKSSRYQFEQPFTELNIPIAEGINMNLVRFLPAADSTKPAKGAVLYFHGNKKNITHYANYASYFTSKGFEVWMPDYPGFGKSTGTLTEDLLHEFARQTYKLARANYAADSIFIYGKSLGTGVAARLATVSATKSLILETPYYSIHSLFSRYLPIYPVGRMIHMKIPTNEYISLVKAPILIVQGTDDGVVPYSNASRLKPLLKPSDFFVTIEGGSHNDLTKYEQYHKSLDSVLHHR